MVVTRQNACLAKTSVSGRPAAEKALRITRVAVVTDTPKPTTGDDDATSAREHFAKNYMKLEAGDDVRTLNQHGHKTLAQSCTKRSQYDCEALWSEEDVTTC